MTSTALRSVIASGLLFVALACGGGDGSRGASENDAARAAARVDGLPVGTDSIIAARVLRIGELDGAPEYAFGQIVAILPAPDGGFYACDGNDVSIRRYDSAGVFVRQVGRRGAGPGEFGNCADIALGRDASLAVNDPSNGRVVFFTPTGEPDRTVTSRVAPGLGGGDGVFTIDTAGRMWTRGWLGGRGESEAALPTHYVIMDASGKRVDSLRVPAAGEGPGRGFMLCTNDGCYDAQPPDSLHAVATTGHLATAGPMAYRVAVRAPDGTVREIVREARPVGYVSAEHAQWEAWRAYMTKQDPKYPPIAIPGIKPLLRGLRFDDAGRLWVKVHVTAEDRPIPPRKPGDLRPMLTWRERNTYDLFDVATGGYIGRVAFPYATEFMASRGNRVWLREEGESGEQLIGVHELRPAAR
ncbi:MAG: hypothetical protein K8S21_09870 [Gemmatimonadetes bacterium]|nr:hypothetical protein [Gemmatimonadota bacterium]